MVASVVAIQYTVLAILAAALFVDRSPATDAWHATADGRFDAQFLLMKIVLVLLYGAVDPTSLPSWLVVAVLISVGVVWVRQFVLRQPHASAFMNVLRAAAGAIFSWAVVCLAVTSLWTSVDVTFPFFAGAVLLCVVVRFTVCARRAKLMQRQPFGLTDSDMLLWCRLRLILAHRIQSNAANMDETVWYGGGSLLMTALKSSHADGQHMQQRVAASRALRSLLHVHKASENMNDADSDPGFAGVVSPGVDQEGALGASVTISNGRGANESPTPGPASSMGQYLQARAMMHNAPHNRAKSVPSTIDMHKDDQQSDDDQVVVYSNAGASPRKVVSENLVQLVYKELQSQNDQNKLSPMLLQLLADIQRHFLLNSFMELMALSQARHHVALPWDVSFWVEQRLEVLRGKQETASGDTELSPVERLLFDQHFQWAIKHQTQWYRDIVAMWTELRQKSPNLGELQHIAEHLAKALTETEHCFKAMMKISRNSAKAMHAYGAFLIRIRHSESEGMALVQRAERLEQAALNQAQREIAHFRMSELCHEHLVMDETAAVIVTSGEPARLGEITTCNAVAASLFKRPKSQIVGQNVNILVPPPIAGVHEHFLRKYSRTGEGRLMNRTRHLLSIDSAGSLLPARCTLRESPPLEGSSFPQITMLMQPLRVAENFILFGDSGQGYQIFCGDHESYRLMGTSFRQLQESAVSMVQFFPEVDLSFAATWDEQHQEEMQEQVGIDEDSSMIPEEEDLGSPSVHMGVCPMGYTSADGVSNPHAQSAQGPHRPHFDLPAGAAAGDGSGGRPDMYLRISGPTSRPASAPRSGRSTRPLLAAMKGFRKTPVRTHNQHGSTSVLASVQKMRIPHCGIIYLLTWKRMTAHHAVKQTPISSQARQLIRRMSHRSATGSTQLRRTVEATPQSKHAPVRRAHTYDSHATGLPHARGPAHLQARLEPSGHNPSAGIASPMSIHRPTAGGDSLVPSSMGTVAREASQDGAAPSRGEPEAFHVITLKGSSETGLYLPAPESKEHSAGTSGSEQSRTDRVCIDDAQDQTGTSGAQDSVPVPMSTRSAVKTKLTPRNNSTPAPERGGGTPHPEEVPPVSPVSNSTHPPQRHANATSVLTSDPAHGARVAPEASRNWSWSVGQKERGQAGAAKPKRRYPSRFQSRFARPSMFEESGPAASRTTGTNNRGMSESVFDGGESHAGGSSYTSAVARYSKLTQHVLDAATTQDHHPSVQHIKLVFVVQFILLIVGAIVVMVYRGTQVTGLELFVDAIQHGTELEQHAQTALTLMSSIILVNQGLHIADLGSTAAALDLEVTALATATALALDETAQLGSKYGVHFDRDMIDIPNGQRVSLRFTPSESASWLASKMHVVASLQPQLITHDHTTVAEVLRASPVLLEQVFPGLISELKQEFVTYAEERERASEIGILTALFVLVLLIGAAAMFFISKLAAHRRVVLRAVASVPLRVVRQLSKAAIMGAKQHLSQLSRGDGTANDAVSEEHDTPRMSDLDNDEAQPFQDMLDTMQSPVHLGAQNAMARNNSDVFHASQQVDDINSTDRGFSMDRPKDTGAPPRFSSHQVLPSAPTSVGDSKASAAHTDGGATMVDVPTAVATLTFSHEALEAEQTRHRSQLRATAKEAARHKPHDSSCFEAAALAKLMMPTVFVCIMVIVLWLDVGWTNSALMQQAYRVFSARDIARRSAASLQVTLLGLNQLPLNGSVPGLAVTTQGYAEAAVAASTALLRGVARDDLAGDSVEGLDSSSSEFTLLTEDSCVDGSDMFSIQQCRSVDSGIFTRGGLQAGLLRFASDVVDLASAAQDGSISRGANATLVAQAAGNRPAYNAIVFGPNSGNLNTTSNLQQLAYPFIIGMCNVLAERLDADMRASSRSAANRSQALVISFLCVLLAASVGWVLPTARRIGRRVYATHALVAAVPPEMQARLPAFSKVLKRIANIQTQHSSSSVNDINTLFTVLDDTDGPEVFDTDTQQVTSRT